MSSIIFSMKGTLIFTSELLQSLGQLEIISTDAVSTIRIDRLGKERSLTRWTDDVVVTTRPIVEALFEVQHKTS